MKEKCPSGRLRSRWEQGIRKDVRQKKCHGEKLRSCGKTEVDGEALL
jgi:hypothetical protein